MTVYDSLFAVVTTMTIELLKKLIPIIPDFKRKQRRCQLVIVDLDNGAGVVEDTGIIRPVADGGCG